MAWRGRKAKAEAADGDGEGPFFGMRIVAAQPAKKARKGAAPAGPQANGPVVGLLGLPWDHSSSYRKGAVKGPRVLREVTDGKLYNPFTEDGTDLRASFSLLDLGDVGAEFRRIDDFDRFADAVEARVQTTVKGPMVFLGGDHACTYATMRALAKGEAGKRWGLVYLDAHPDLYVNYAGTSNSHACPARRLIDEGFVKGPQVLQVGVHASTPSQNRYAEQAGVRTITAAEFMQSGATRAAETVVRGLLGQVDAIYLSLDMDVLDPAVAPGVGNPEPGGLSVRDVVQFLNGLAPLPVRAVDVMEYNPVHDPLRITGYAAAKYLKEALGLLAKAGKTA